MKRLHTYKSFKILNEELTEENIEKDPNTNHEEKENQMIKLNIDQYNKYKSKKGVFDNMFGNLEEEIDVTTLNKLIDENPFSKQYTQLLYKKRDKITVEELIKQKEEKVKELKQRMNDSSTDNTDTDSINNDSDYNSENVFEDIDSNNNDENTDSDIDPKQEIIDLEKEISELKKRISKNDVDELLKKWDSHLLRFKKWRARINK